jgi:hypothetical protein
MAENRVTEVEDCGPFAVAGCDDDENDENAFVVGPFSGAGVDGALEYVSDLFREQAGANPRRWQKQSLNVLVGHLSDHTDSICFDPDRIDPETRRYEAAHVAARALMVLQRLIERKEDDE